MCVCVCVCLKIFHYSIIIIIYYELYSPLEHSFVNNLTNLIISSENLFDNLFIIWRCFVFKDKTFGIEDQTYSYSTYVLADKCFVPKSTM